MLASVLPLAARKKEKKQSVETQHQLAQQDICDTARWSAASAAASSPRGATRYLGPRGAGAQRQGPSYFDMAVWSAACARPSRPRPPSAGRATARPGAARARLGEVRIHSTLTIGERRAQQAPSAAEKPHLRIVST